MGRYGQEPILLNVRKRTYEATMPRSQVKEDGSVSEVAMLSGVEKCLTT